MNNQLQSNFNFWNNNVNNSGVINNTGDMTFFDYGTSAVFNNSGSFSTTRNIDINDNWTFNNSGTFTIDASARVRLYNAILDGTTAYTNNGIIEYRDGANSPNAWIENNGSIEFLRNPTPVTIGKLTGNSSGTINGAGNFFGNYFEQDLIVKSGDYAGSLGTMKSLTKATSGILTLTGNNAAFAAPVTVSGGSLVVGGFSSASAVLGNGTADLTVNNGASAGGFGTLNFNNATFNAGSTYYVGLNSLTQSGQISTQGNLTITGANLQVDGTNISITSPQNYTIALYGGVLTGTFASVQPTGLIEISNVQYGTGNNSSIIITARQASNLSNINDPSSQINDALSQLTQTINSREATAINPSDEIRIPTGQFLPMTRTSSYKRFFYDENNSKAPQFSKLRGFFQTLADDGPIISEHNENRFWIAPYYIQGVNRSEGTSNRAKDYFEGAAIGLEQRSTPGRWVVGITSSFGLGQQTTPSAVRETKASSQTVSLGLYHAKEFLSEGRYDVSVNGFYTTYDAKRYGSPLPGQIYQAKAKFISRAFSAMGMVSWRFKLDKDLSLRPNMGIGLVSSYRPAFVETDAGVNNRYYASQRDTKAEPYAGIGLRKKWDNDHYEWKLTGIYEHGYILGSNKKITNVRTFTGGIRDNLIELKGFGKHTNYLTI